MKIHALATLTAIVFALAPTTEAATTYQATGPILELTDSKIVIQKDTEKWEIARTDATKVTGELKVGAKVTIHYTMSATAIEAKPAKTDKVAPAAKPKPAKKP